jgi:SAM-dependent methyltransferase
MTSPQSPLPDLDLVRRVTGSDDLDWFVESGRLSVHDFERGLATVDARINDFGSILDFGCGCGRVLRWLAEIVPNAELHGVDIDGEAIAWTAAHLAAARTTTIDGLPPTPYEGDSFDLIVNHSVFSHLPEHYQDRWLEELARIARPGAPVLLSVHGEYAFARLRATWLQAGANPPDEFLRAYYRDGFLHIREDNWKGGPFPDYYHTTFHAPWYIFSRWTKYFDVRAYIARGALAYQDLVVLSCP